VNHAKGVFLYDDQGHKVLDGISSWWCCHHGHRHPKLLEALQQQSNKLVHVSLAGITHSLAEDLADRLSDLTQLPYVFFSDNGSTSIEVALKMCWQRWALKKQSKRQLIVGFNKGYHGDTLACMSAGNTDFHQEYATHFHQALYMPSPSLGEECLTALKKTLKERADECACVVIEPLLQAAGGMLVHEPEILKEIYLLCQQYDTPLIADEIAVGLGRCGALWGCQRAGFTPDILCTSKGLTGGMLPLAATCVSEEIASDFMHANNPEQCFNHGHTYTGHPLASAVAMASLDLVEEEGFLPHCRELETMLHKELPKFDEEIPLASSRQMGTVGIVELDVEKTSPLMPYFREMIKKGYFLRPLDNIAYFWPPLCITVDEYKEMLDVSRETLKEIYTSSHV